MGYKAEKRTFKTTRDNLYMLSLQVGVLLFICGFFSLMYGGPLEIAAFLLSLFAISLLLLEVSGKPVETSIMPRHLSENVFTSFDESRSKRIIVSAHYDTQRGSIMFHPKIVDKLSAIYNISYIGFGLIPIGILFNIFNLVIASAILRIGLIIVFANIIFMAICEVTGRYIQGANDNGTGVALTLALANYYINHKDKFPDNVDMVFLFTGSEETGERGMKNFIREYRKKLSKETKFIILDNLGTGKVTYLEGEGMIFYKRAGKMLLDIAEEMAKGRDGKVQKMKNLLLPTDALPAMAAGFDAIAFLAKDEKGRLGNYHWHTDTIENVDTQLLSYEEEFFKEYLVKVAERLNKM